MKIACVQIDVAFGEPERNFVAVEKYIQEAAENNADVVALPEMWNTGYALENLEILADGEGKRTKECLSKLAKKHHVNIVGGSVSTKKGNHFFNTMFVANRDGKVISEYDKVHLFKLMNEHLFLQAGDKMNVFQLDGTTCGGVICYDLRFPEWIRAHVLKGARIMFISAEWPKPRLDHWQVLLRARAIENQCFVIAVNRIGNDPNNEFGGHSMIFSPWGEILLDGKGEEGIFYQEIDLEAVEQIRKTIPVFQDRRVDLY